MDEAKAPRVRLSPDLNKIVEAILFILKMGEDQGKTVTQYDIVKTLFLADRRHLNEYGRPITFDNYVAMKHGPVPSKSYDLLKGAAAAQAEVGGELPWTATAQPGSAAMRFTATVDPDLDELSPSEAEILADSFVAIKGLNFDQVRRLTHEDAAYIEAWEDGETGNGSYPMSLGLLFDHPNWEVANELEFVSKNGMY